MFSDSADAIFCILQIFLLCQFNISNSGPQKDARTKVGQEGQKFGKGHLQ